MSDVRGAKEPGRECEAGLDAAQGARALGGRPSGKLETWRKDDEWSLCGSY